VEKGSFSEDIFFRLNVVSLTVPLLVDRREDIPLLINHFIQKYCLAFHKQVFSVDKDVLQILTHYSYPGNVRELENIIERAVALTGSEEIGTGDLPRDLQKFDFDTLAGEELTTLAEMERRYIKTVLESTGYNRSRTAEILDIPRTTLWRKIKMYGLG
jgi:DNA-binding NtrC family response regulator